MRFLSVRRRKIGMVAALLLLAGAGVWVASAGSGLAQEPPGVRCRPAEEQFGLDDPIEMNTVTLGSIAKTVKVDKEIFLCDDDGDGVPDRIVDVQLFAEIVERMAPEPKPTEKRFEVVICEKRTRSPIPVRCHLQDPPPENVVEHFDQCVPAGTDRETVTRPPRDPIEMNTVAFGKHFKTIKAQKEIFECRDPRTQRVVIVDVETFTEIIEVRTDQTARPVAKRVETAVCVKEFQPGPAGTPERDVPRVRSCGFTPTQEL